MIERLDGKSLGFGLLLEVHTTQHHRGKKEIPLETINGRGSKFFRIWGSDVLDVSNHPSRSLGTFVSPLFETLVEWYGA
jgi:hypothetical protein